MLAWMARLCRMSRTGSRSLMNMARCSLVLTARTIPRILSWDQSEEPYRGANTLRKKYKSALRGCALAIALGGFGTACAEKVSPPCSAAQAAFPQQKEGEMPPFFSDPVKSKGAKYTAEDLRANWSGRTPSLDSLTSYQRTAQTSSLACPNVRKIASAKGQIVSHQEGRAALERMGLVQGKTRYLYQVSMPILSKDGKEAIVEISSSSNHLFGGTDLLLLMQKNGRWEIVGRKALVLG